MASLWRTFSEYIWGVSGSDSDHDKPRPRRRRREISPIDVSSSSDEPVSEGEEGSRPVGTRKETRGLTGCQRSGEGRFHGQEGDMGGPGREADRPHPMTSTPRLNPRETQLSWQAQSPYTPRANSRLERDRNFCRRKEKDPPQFNGKSDWTEYLSHFEAVIEWNRWDYEECGLQLAFCLIDEAREVLTGLPEHLQKDYSSLVAALTGRYSPSGREARVRIDEPYMPSRGECYGVRAGP